MPSIEDIYGVTFLNAQFVKNIGLVGKSLTIKSVRTELMRNDQTKLLLTLDGVDKELILNKTNAKIIAARCGNDYTQWVGKQIVLQIVPKNFQGSIIDGIQIFCP